MTLQSLPARLLWGVKLHENVTFCYNLGVKNNYRSAHMDLTCRWCKDKPETQDHILKDCPSFTDHTQQIDMSEIMNPQRSVKKPEATIISNIYKKINGGP